MTPHDVYDITYVPMCDRADVRPADYETWYALSERLFGRQDLKRLESANYEPIDYSDQQMYLNDGSPQHTSEPTNRLKKFY